MTDSLAERRRSVPLALIAVLALVGALLVTVSTSGHDHAHAAEGASHSDMVTTSALSQVMPQHSMPVAVRTAKQLAFHDAMRKLWEDHVTWTRLAIVTFADGSKGFDATATRLLANQVDIGNAIKPFYGKAAGKALTKLLQSHITIAVEILQAAKAGDTAAFTEATKRWDANARAIADFLHAANPHSWGRKMMRSDMRVHLKQTLAEAADELAGDYAGSVAEYDHVHRHILRMADMLSSGIMAQFPGRFR